MALTSTLFTGLSGLDVNQTRLNVVGNNIANVNTVAFKSSRALFKPQFYITENSGAPPSASGTFGGSNPSQRGLGAVVAAIEKDFTPGSIEPTGKSTEMAIDGDGFFIVRGTGEKYTRDGSFVLNQKNQLVTSNGDFVQGYMIDPEKGTLLKSPVNIQINLGGETSARQTEGVTLEGNLNAAGEDATGASILLSDALVTTDGVTPLDETTSLTLLSKDGTTALFTAGEKITLQGTKGGRSLKAFTMTVGDSGFTTVGDMLSFFQRGLGIDTNITGEPKPGVVLEGSRIVITGNVGDDNALTLPGSGFTNASGSAPLSFAGGSDADGNRDNPNGESVYTSFDVYDSRGHQVRVDVSAVLESTSDTDSTWRFFITSPDAVTGDPATESLVIGNGTLVFDNEGKLMSSTNTTISLPRNEQGAKTPMSIKLDFGAMTSLVSQASEMVMTRQDGMPTGTLDAFSVGSDGTITGSYNNGLTKTLGQVIVAVFANPQGLVDVGGNMYVTGANSGEPTRTIPMSMGAGAIKAGALELSNVDLSEEFINLIISSTGFSAASRVITTSDQLLTELLNTSR